MIKISTCAETFRFFCAACFQAVRSKFVCACAWYDSRLFTRWFLKMRVENSFACDIIRAETGTPRCSPPNKCLQLCASSSGHQSLNRESFGCDAIKYDYNRLYFIRPCVSRSCVSRSQYFLYLDPKPLYFLSFTFPARKGWENLLQEVHQSLPSPGSSSSTDLITPLLAFCAFCLCSSAQLTEGRPGL